MAEPARPTVASMIGRWLSVRPRLGLALGLGLAVALALPNSLQTVTRGLLAWNAGLWTYLTLMIWMMMRADHGRMRRHAAEQAQSAMMVLGLVVAAALSSMVAIVFELAWVRQHGPIQGVPHVLLALATVVGAWLLLPVVFTLSYASHYYHAHSQPDGLRFPEDSAEFLPQYSDFLYVALTLAVAAQISDVIVTTRRMRRLVMLQSLLSFAFNTAILALMINIAAGLF